MSYYIRQEERFYTIQELKHISERYGITVTDFLHYRYGDKISKELMNKNKLYFGKIKIPQNELSKYGDILYQKIKHYAYQRGKKRD